MLLGAQGVLLLAVHEDAARARFLGLHAGPEGDGAVEDVAGQDLLQAEVEVGRIGELEGGQQGRDRAAVVAELDGHLALDHHRQVVPLGAVLEEPVGGEEARERAVDAELLLDLGHVEADLPADRLRALRQDLAAAQ